jgi:hypothetical protein
VHGRGRIISLHSRTEGPSSSLVNERWNTGDSRPLLKVESKTEDDLSPSSSSYVVSRRRLSTGRTVRGLQRGTALTCDFRMTHDRSIGSLRSSRPPGTGTAACSAHGRDPFIKSLSDFSRGWLHHDAHLLLRAGLPVGRYACSLTRMTAPTSSSEKGSRRRAGAGHPGGMPGASVPPGTAVP